METIYDMFNAKEIATYWEMVGSNREPYISEELFPARKKLGLDLKWIKGSKGLPVALQPSSFDANANIRDRIGVSKVETEMPFFREGMKINEKDRQELNKVQESNSNYKDLILDNIFDDIVTLVDGARVVPERMCMQLMSTGKIEITDNREALKYDYHFDANHKEKLLSTSQWSNTTVATPIEDIERWMDTVEADTGTRPNRAICTTKTFNYIVKNDNVQALFDKKARRNDVKEYLESEIGLTVVVYNKKFKDTEGNQKNFFPDDIFTLFPEGTLGNTWYGTTPEESDLLAGNNKADVEVVNTGVAITSIEQEHPVNVETIVSEIVLPSFERMDELFIADVAGN